MSNFLPSLQAFAKGTAATAAGLSTVGAGLLYYGQNYLIYPSAFPPGSRTDVPNPGQYGLPYQDLELKTQDSVTLRCYLLLQAKVLPQSDATPMPEGTIYESLSDEEFAAGRPTIIMFHGNGGNLGHRIPLARVFFSKMRCNVLMMCYRGYGLSEGTPSEKGIKMDAQAGLDYILTHPSLSKSPIILYGQSIGGAVSIDLASRNPLAMRALILENTFLSLPKLVPTALPVLGPFAFLCHQKWDSASKIPLIPRNVPILMMSGLKDEVVPAEHMKGLWEIIKKRDAAGPVIMSRERKEEDARRVTGSMVGEETRCFSKFIEFEDGAHNDTCVQPGYWATIAEFIASLH